MMEYLGECMNGKNQGKFMVHAEYGSGITETLYFLDEQSAKDYVKAEQEHIRMRMEEERERGVLDGQR